MLYPICYMMRRIKNEKEASLFIQIMKVNGGHESI